MTFSKNFNDRLIAEALTWKQTPFFHNTRKKGIGADCLGLVLGTWEQVSIMPYKKQLYYTAPKIFNSNHFELEKSFCKISRQIQSTALENGDVICFKFINNQYHLAFYLKRNGIENLLHSRMKIGVAEEFYSPFWKSKTFKIFRLLEV